MLKKRIIPLLLLNEDRLIKTIKFDKYRDVGDPVSTAKIFSDSDADELIFLDVNKKKRSIENLINKNKYPENKQDLENDDDNKDSALGSIGLKPKIVH